MLKWLKNLFNKEIVPEVRKVMLVNHVWAYGFKSKFEVNQPYFHLKYKVLKEGNMNEMSIYFDKMDKLKTLTNQKWILIVKERD